MDFYWGQDTARKDAVREWMTIEYKGPPKFMLSTLSAEHVFVTAIGDIILKDEEEKEIHYAYCDVWRFRDNKLAELQAFITKKDR